MSTETHYLNRIAISNEQLSREVKELSILLQETLKLLVIIAKNTKKEEIVIQENNEFIKAKEDPDELNFAKEHLNYLSYRDKHEEE